MDGVEKNLKTALLHGNEDILLYPFYPFKIIESISRFCQVKKQGRPGQLHRKAMDKEKINNGQVLTVFSTKGGVGKTFVAANLAVALAQHGNSKVVLVDLDLDFGNAALALNLIPRYTIPDVINDLHKLDADLIDNFLMPHRSGIKFLAANTQPQSAGHIKSKQIASILDVLQQAFDYVVVDMPTRFYDPLDPAFQEADFLFLVTNPEMTALRNAKASLMALGMLDYPRNKIGLILNRVDARGEIKPKEVEGMLNKDIFGIVPEDYALVASSLNKGIPVVLLYPRAPVSAAFQEMAEKIKSKREVFPERLRTTAEKEN